jgi:hypothetical protein
VKISPAALAALSLHNAQRQITTRTDGAWWLIDAIKWGIIQNDLSSAERDFVVAVIEGHNQRWRRTN